MIWRKQRYNPMRVLCGTFAWAKKATGRCRILVYRDGSSAPAGLWFVAKP